MAFKMIAVDLDGTLLTSRKTILAETVKTLRQANAAGIKIVLCSGRPLSGVMPYEEQLGLSGGKQYAIVFNGAVIQDLAGHVLMSQEMDRRDLHTMFRLQRLSHVNLHFETTKCFWTCDHDLSVRMQINAALTNNRMKVCARDQLPKDFKFSKVGFTCDEGSDQIAKLWAAIPDWVFQSYDVVRSLDNIIELNRLGASKGNALMDLAQRLRIEQDQVMVFGDQGNDVSMFMNPAFTKVAMGNAISSIKDKADYVALDNDHNGIAKTLKKMVL